MAIDKLVDSTQLDANLTSVANAIRTKGGTSAELAFPQGFVDAVDAIPTGGGDIELSFTYSQMLYGLKFYTANISPSIKKASFVFAINSNYPLTSFLNQCQGIEEVELSATRLPPSGMNNCFYMGGFKKIKINFSTSGTSTSEYTISGCPNLEVIDGEPLDYSNNVASTILFLQMPKLREVRFVKGSIKKNFRLSGDVLLSQMSLASIANGLDETATGKQIQKPSASSDWTAILGTVTDGVFELDAQGSTSLQDFITNVKGWTVYA